ncbi:copper chaperone PCu(A)C [Haliea sp. AH-315-K21]|uniref:Copper chaperone PCu(A)C n=1 Tax=SAR86 cluster bacterium TaxID=2030880 RepID=A0A2A5CCD6_9GAMM|nr:copper chaperone PCu(A)C [Haliea sp. AH-315-K21]PCJ41195.1 MAG: hypothetical protein COA71_09130 [SAR86 cluster bacterium]
MNLNITKLSKVFIVPLAMLFFQTTAYAQPVMVPGFMGIESFYIENSGSDTANAYFTIVNFDDEPMRILSASGDAFGNAIITGTNNEELEYIEIMPNERVVMAPSSMYFQLSDLGDSLIVGETHEITLLIRRGREAGEMVEETTRGAGGAFSGGRLRDAGIINEKEYVVKVPVRN